LPIVVEIVDTNDKIQLLLPHLEKMASEGDDYDGVCCDRDVPARRSEKRPDFLLTFPHLAD